MISALGLALTSFGCAWLSQTPHPAPPPPLPSSPSPCPQQTSGTPAINTIQPTSGSPAYVSAVRFPGTSIRICGVQLCDAATKVDVGRDKTLDVVDSCSSSGAQAAAHVSRLSIDGPVRLSTGTALPASPLASSDMFTVRTMRNQNGFNFENTGNIPQEDLSDYKELFGAEQFMVQIDPCSLLNLHCPIPTGVPDPTAYIYALVTMAMTNGNGELLPGS